MHVLIVDDNASFCDNIGRFLLRQIPRIGYVAVAMDGMEALEKLNDFPADVALVDVRMPHLGGIELAEILHHRYPRVKVVFISAYDDSKYLKQAIRLEALDYLLKPVDYEELIRVLNRVLDRVEADSLNERRLAREKNYSLRQLLLSLIEGGEDIGNAAAAKPLLEEGNVFILMAMEYPLGLRMEEALSRYPLRSGQWAFPSFGGSAYLVSGYEKRDFSQAFFDGQKLIEWLRRDAGIPARGFLSDFVTSLPDLTEARTQIEALYDIAYFKADMHIITYRELEGAQLLSALSDHTQAIMESVEKGCHGEAVQGLVHLKEQMILRRVYDKKGIERLCLGVIREAAKRRAQDGGALDELYRSDLAVMEKISAFDSFEALLRFTTDFLRVTSQGDSSDDDGPSSRLLSAFTAYVEGNYQNALTLDGIAAQLYVSRSYLSAFIKKNLNQTVVSYVNMLRLTKGREMLLKTDLTINEIAGRVGFSDGNYFIKQYKKQFGTTPRADRQRQRQGR